MNPMVALREPELVTAGPAAAGWHVERVTDARALAQLAPVWNALAERCGLDHPFGRFEWTRSWWEAFGRGHDLQVMVVKCGREVAAIAPLMLTRGRLWGLPVRKLESIGNDHTPRFELLVPPGNEDACDVLWRSLTHDSSGWDVLQLAELPVGSRTHQIVERLAEQSKWPVGRWQSDEAPFIDATTVFDGFPASAGKKHQTNVRRQLKRLQETGVVDLEVVAGGDGLEAALDDAFRLEAGEWKIAERTAIISDPAVETFYRELAREYAAAGVLRLLFLRVNGRRIGFAFGVRHEDSFHILKCGYDVAHAKHAPVHLLCHLFLRQAPALGVKTFEFLGACEEWKLRWTDTAKTHVWLYVFPNAWWARLLHRTRFGLVPQLTRQPAPMVSDAFVRVVERRSCS